MSHRTMGPPPDKDISMAPPQSYPPPQHNGALQPKREPSSGEIQEKYSRLKRRYFDLEQKMKDIELELQRSGERNTKLRQERSVLLERIVEFEEAEKDRIAGRVHDPHLPRHTGAFPRSLTSQRAKNAFEANLKQAMSELETEDHDVDPMMTSRHVGPAARKRQAEEEASVRDVGARGEDDSVSAAAAAGGVAAAAGGAAGGRRAKRQRGAGANRNSVPESPAMTDEQLQHQQQQINQEGQQSSLPTPAASSSSSSSALVTSSGTRMPIDHPHPHTSPSPRSSTRSQPVGPGVPPPAPHSHSQPQAPQMKNESVTTPPKINVHSLVSVSGSVASASVSERSQSPVSPLPSPSGGETPGVGASRGGSRTHGHAQQSPLPVVNRSVMSPPPPPAAGTPTSTSSAYHTMHIPTRIPPQSTPTPSTTSVMSSTTSTMSILGPRPSEIQRQTKPKRLKAHTVVTKSYSIPTVPRDSSGRPLLPLNVGIMMVVHLGEVCMREHFHTERYIFPVGYEVKRRYLSTIDPTSEVIYHCTILDGGDGPKFQIIASDMPDKPIIAGTATGAWSGIVRAANMIRKRQHSNSVSGPDYFGLGQNTIKHLIQELPGADRLRDYVRQNFVEGGPLGGRHAAVTPALPEEFDATLPIGGYYPHDRERQRERVREKEREMERERSSMPMSPNARTHHAYSSPHQAHTLPPPPPPSTSSPSPRSGQHHGQMMSPGHTHPHSHAPPHPPPPGPHSHHGHHNLTHVAHSVHRDIDPKLEEGREREREEEWRERNNMNGSGGAQQQQPQHQRRRSSRLSGHSMNGMNGVVTNGVSSPHERERSEPDRDRDLHRIKSSPGLSPISPISTTSSATIPAVPRTLASIMHAYPPPAGENGHGHGLGHEGSVSPRGTVVVNGNGSGGSPYLREERR